MRIATTANMSKGKTLRSEPSRYEADGWFINVDDGGRNTVGMHLTKDEVRQLLVHMIEELDLEVKVKPPRPSRTVVRKRGDK